MVRMEVTVSVPMLPDPLRWLCELVLGYVELPPEVELLPALEPLCELPELELGEDELDPLLGDVELDPLLGEL
jgi:hypothetical protein